MVQKFKDNDILNQKTVKVNLEIVIRKIQKSELLSYMKEKSEKVKLSTLRKRLSVIKGSLSKEIIKDREDRV